jgi:hypothetical protein
LGFWGRTDGTQFIGCEVFLDVETTGNKAD